MNIADLARVRDEDLAGEPAGQASGEGARALMESITATGREPAGRRRVPPRRSVARSVARGVGLGVVAAGLAAALVVWTPLGGPATEYANAAVSLRTGEDFVEVRINDPEADAATFTEAFRAVGLDAEVRKAPVAPQDVGKLVGPYTEGKFPPGTGITIHTYQEGCRSAWCGRVSMPVGLTGKVVFGIGRPAAPGELWSTPVQADFYADGGVVGGYDPRGRPVGQVRDTYERAGIEKISYVVMWVDPDGSGSGYDVDVAHVKDDWPVETAWRIASDAVAVHVAAPADVPKDSLPKIDGPRRSPWWKD
ncbi:hypothetical protein HD597_012194 [Nonomuraea thailandensis]|uniref:Uncharacterized protein n=1 Tax=Nonomuraea thailandensis TaxID=1188745 RepID=A0A9X2GTD9_9ACTN|nr:hypothetical protein [Nonomuraea thailandensis]MCP2365174.1 hypothetical protein [Nonomuraea thailandensis]